MVTEKELEILQKIQEGLEDLKNRIEDLPEEKEIFVLTEIMAIRRELSGLF